MRVFIIAAVASATAFISLPSLAQTERLPAAGRAERQVNQINRDIQLQQRGLRENQQTQFEINQLRGEIQRGSQFRSMTGPGFNPGCPAGSVGC